MGWIGDSMGTNGRQHGLFRAENGAVLGLKFTYFRTNCPATGSSPGDENDKRGSAADRPWHVRGPHRRTDRQKSQQSLTLARPQWGGGGLRVGFNAFRRRAGLSLFFRTLPLPPPRPRGRAAGGRSDKNAEPGPAGGDPGVKKWGETGLLPGQTFAGAQKKYIFAELC